jgi:hypothetical protein
MPPSYGYIEVQAPLIEYELSLKHKNNKAEISNKKLILFILFFLNYFNDLMIHADKPLINNIATLELAVTEQMQDQEKSIY